MRDWLTYRVSDFLLFSPQTYYRMFERYHEAIWPLHFIVLAMVVAVVLLVRRSDRWTGVAISAVLAAGWLWVGVAFHVQRYAQINWAASYFGAGFVAQAALLTWYGVVRRQLGSTRPDAGGGRLARVMLIVALVAPPLAGLAADRAWSQVELALLTPDATAVMTLALVLGATPHPPRLLLVVPLTWCAIAAATLSALESPEAWVPVAAIAACVVPLRRSRGQSH